MKKIIFLCLVLIITSVSIIVIHEVKASKKAMELVHHKFSKVENPASLTTAIVATYSAFCLICKGE